MSDVVCFGCGCACDDIEVGPTSDGTVQAARACDRGLAWFARGARAGLPVCLVEGKPVSVAEGIDRAIEKLTAARRPLICGLEDVCLETQVAAFGVSEMLRGVVAGTRPVGGTHGYPKSALVTTSLGDLRDRADLLVFWNTDVTETHPRHLERYSLFAPGARFPRGRGDRQCVVVQERPLAIAEHADQVLSLREDSTFVAVWSLRAAVRDLPIDAEQIDEVQRQTGVSWVDWRRLAEALRSARYGVLVFDAEPNRGADSAASHPTEAFAALAADVNRSTRFALLPHREAGNALGAEHVATWRTGFAGPIDFASSYPRMAGGGYTVEKMLRRREPDAILALSPRPFENLPEDAADHARAIPMVMLRETESDDWDSVTVAFRVSPLGLGSDGTVLRMDEIPMPIRSFRRSNYPSTRQVVEQLARRIREFRIGGPV